MEIKERPGVFITLEGPDGCGKSTQTRLLTDWLKAEGHEILVTKEPTDSPLGKLIRKSLHGELKFSLEAEALLFAGDRAQHVSEVILPNLKKEKIVVSERYLYSSLAYQTSRGIPVDWVRKINKPAIEPDLTLFIDITPETGAKRISSTRESDSFEEDLELQKKVRNKYRELAEESEMPIIDGSQSEKEVQKEIRTEVQKILN